MTREQANEYINSNPQVHLKRAKQSVQGNPTYICPFCGNGSGTSGTGLTSKDGRHWHCFKCGFHGDMVELIAKEQGIVDGGSGAAFEAARAVYGVVVDGKSQDVAGNAQHTHNTGVVHDGEGKQSKGVVKTDCREFVKAHCGKGADTSYLQARGVSKEVAAALHFGYDAENKAVVIPITKDGVLYYFERYIEDRKASNGERVRYHVPKGGTNAGIFNEAALSQDKPVFICEGAINAASIVEVGGQALAINSTSNAGAFLDRLKKRGSTCKRFVVCMDDDEAGAAASATLVKGLKGMGYEVAEYHHTEGYNDANDALRGGREAFAAAVEAATKSFDKAALAEIQSHKVGSMIDAFWSYVNDDKNNKPIPTGFGGFDKAIGGGLLPKFYIIGAITSLGKTTFVLQIADYIAQDKVDDKGNKIEATDVLIFSLEMSKEDIIARSISRTTYEIESKPKGDTKRAKTELGIAMGSRYKDYSAEELNLIIEATNQYKAYAAEHISIYEGKRTADEVREIVERYITLTGKIPVVIVDYLQILQPAPSLTRATVREQTDYNIDVFTSMRRELKTPVIGISAFNRQSYTAVADNSSFKESGTIEYSGDCIITLELDYERADKGTDATKANKAKESIKEALRKEPREVKLTFQKNRGNKVGSTLYFLYHAKFNHFAEDWTKDAEL